MESQDKGYSVVEDKPAAEQKRIEVEVDDATAFTLKLQEFDKAIAETEAQGATLKAQKAAFIYNTNLNNIVARSKQQPVEPAQEQPVEPAAEGAKQ